MDFNIPQSSNEKFTVTSSSKYNICVCCLTRNASFISLITCKHAKFFRFIPSFVMNFSNKLVCRECHAMVRKFIVFIQQVEQNSRCLNSQALNIKTNNKIHNLKKSPIELSYAVNSEPIMFEVKVGVANQEPEYQISVVKNQPDNDDNSDFENNLPSYEMKKDELKLYTKIITTRKKMDVVKNKPPLVVIDKKVEKPAPNYVSIENLEGKIRIVVLTGEEVTLEREQNRKKKCYLSRPYKCENCILGFDHEIVYKEHLDKQHTMKPGGIVCVICKSVFSSESTYKAHYERYFKRYECEACGRRNSTLDAVMKHYSDTHEPLTESYVYECEDCDFTASYYRIYRRHRQQHRGIIQCQECGNIFASQSTLKSHMRSIHSSERLHYKCKDCDKHFLTNVGLKIHHESKHNTNHVPLFCSKCNKSFQSSAGYRYHLLRNSAHVTEADKKFICDHCGRKFVHKTDLRLHIEHKHMDKSPHRCQQCNKQFAMYNGLRRHIDFVHNKKKMPKDKICDQCGQGFTTLQILKSHVRTHTGERPFSCTKCTSTFGHSGALYTHNKLVHLRK